jgi:uncharacterized protein YkwD
MGFVACNVVTGADGVEFGELDPAEGAGGSDAQQVGSVSSSSGSSQSTGAGMGGNVPGGVGGAATSSTGAGPSSNSASASSSTAAATASASSSSGGPTGCGGAGPMTTELDVEEQNFLVLINDYRKQNNLGPLKACRSLNRTAQGHSEDMRDQDYFSHTGLNNSTPWDRACDACYDLGCGPKTAMAENIAAGNSDAQKTFTQWKNSPGHDKNMKGANFTMIGIGRATGGGKYGVYWTNVFGGDSEASCN